MTEKRRGLSRREIAAAGDALAHHLLEEPGLARVARLGLYAALPGEPPTRPLFEALAPGSTLLLFPRTLPDDRLAFARVRRWGELRPGRFGVLEPPEAALSVSLEPADWLLVPGLAFDAAGHRLGRGRGCFDRTFPPASPAPRLLGVGYAFQMVSAVPCDSRDRAMDAIVTERGIQRVSGGAA